MEDYIFLIVAIVLSVLSAVNQNKKKKAAQANTDSPKVQHRNPLFDQLFGSDLFDEPEVEKVQPVKIQRVKPEVKVSQVPRESFVRHEYKTTLPPTIKRKEKPQPEKNDLLVEDSTEDNDEVSYLSDFSLRKAFVYSEILNRKY
jgi:hypothetical protein